MQIWAGGGRYLQGVGYSFKTEYHHPARYFDTTEGDLVVVYIKLLRDTGCQMEEWWMGDVVVGLWSGVGW